MPSQIGDVIEVAARAEFNGVDDVINVFQFSLGTPGPVTDEQTVDDVIAILEGLYTLFIGMQSLVVLYRDLRLRNVTQNRVLGVHPWPTIAAGLSALVPLPPGNAGVLNFTTDYPKITPRKYLGGLIVGGLDPDGSLSTASVVVMISMANYLLNVQTQPGGDYLYCHYSTALARTIFPLGAVVTDISGYQRRRKQGRGS